MGAGVGWVVEDGLLLGHGAVHLGRERRIGKLFCVITIPLLLLLLLLLSIVIGITGLLQTAQIGGGQAAAEGVGPLFCLDRGHCLEWGVSQQGISGTGKRVAGAGEGGVGRRAPGVGSGVIGDVGRGADAGVGRRVEGAGLCDGELCLGGCADGEAGVVGIWGGDIGDLKTANLVGELPGGGGLCAHVDELAAGVVAPALLGVFWELARGDGHGG